MTASTRARAPYRHRPPAPRWWTDLKEEAEEAIAAMEAVEAPVFCVLVPELREPGTFVAVSSNWGMAPATAEQLEQAGLA